MADEKSLKLRPPIAHPDGAEHRRLISGSVQGLLEREILQETLANRPAAGTANKLFVSTDEPILYRDNGTSWEVVRGILADTLANRPAAGNAGSFFYATDENWIYRDNGSSWESFGAVRNSGGVPEILADTIGNRPSAGTAGNLFVSTDELRLYRDTGSAWELLSGPTNETAIATTSGTSHSVTGIPSWVTKITISFEGVSLDGADDLLVAIGDAGGLESTGYVSTSVRVADGATAAAVSSTSGFIIFMSNAAAVFSGTMTLTNIDGNTWISDHQGKRTTISIAGGSGDKTLSATLDRVTLKTTGTDNFDAGKVNILYE